ncbi:MAG: hypothetical protein II956_00020 [Bacteroidales bacterium]|nr:hypothetical protein [Bacteroidales bacterium]
MKNIKILFAVFLAAMVCLTVSCKKEDKNNDEPEKTAKYLTATEFASSSWTGQDSKQKEVTLTVSNTTNMTLKYYVVKTVSKTTQETFEPKEVTITYTFNEEQGTFSGTGNDNNSYSGTLSSKTSLSLKMPSGNVTLSKKQ